MTSDIDIIIHLSITCDFLTVLAADVAVDEYTFSYVSKKVQTYVKQTCSVARDVISFRAQKKAFKICSISHHKCDC